MPEDFPPQPPPFAPSSGFPGPAAPPPPGGPAAGYAQRGPYAGYAPPQYASPYPQPGYPPPGYTPPGYPPNKRSGWFWAAITAGILAVIVIVFCVFVASLARSVAGSTETASAGEDSVAVLDISGVITDADKIDKQLQKFADDSNVKAIILHIDSPGGGAAASQ